MKICICNNISDNDVKTSKYKDFEDFLSQNNLGSKCKTCINTLKKLYEKKIDIST